MLEYVENNKNGKENILDVTTISCDLKLALMMIKVVILEAFYHGNQIVHGWWQR